RRSTGSTRRNRRSFASRCSAGSGLFRALSRSVVTSGGDPAISHLAVFPNWDEPFSSCPPHWLAEVEMRVPFLDSLLVRPRLQRKTENPIAGQRAGGETPCSGSGKEPVMTRFLWLLSHDEVNQDITRG